MYPIVELRTQVEELLILSEDTKGRQVVFSGESAFAQSNQQNLKASREDHFLRRSLTEIVGHLLKETWARDSSGLPAEEESDVQRMYYLQRRNVMAHVHALNPFDHYATSVMEPLMEMFLQRVNSVLFFFSEEALKELLRLAAYTILSNENMSELCLVLALGAQISNDMNDDMTIVWYENGRRYLDDDNSGSKLWVMRVTALISLYHIRERPDTSRHYLGA